LPCYYGLANKNQLVAFAKRVCDVIGHGKNNRAVPLLLETCAAETLLAQARDKTLYGAGAGVAQVDEGTFDWLKAKYSQSAIAKRLFEQLNVNLSEVSYNELDYSPLLSLIFCRLRYWTVTDLIPDSVEARGEYWKRWYNSSEGKGSAQEYIERCESTHVNDLVRLVA